MIVTLRAESPAYGGYVIGRDGKIIFIKGAVPGELVEVSLDEQRKDYAVASVREVLEPSPLRREAPCKVFGICGGCQLQFIEYAGQVSMKEDILRDAMRRIAGLEVTLMPPLSEREFRYRYRAQFKINERGQIGFYREGSRQVVPIDECPLMIDGINTVLAKLNSLDLRGLKEIHLVSGDTTAALVKGAVSEELIQQLFDAGISGIGLENGDSFGKDYVSLDLDGMRYTVTPWSFFQGHWSLNVRVVGEVLQRLRPLEGTRVLDLYSGAGNFALPVAREAAEVAAVEENGHAVEDGRRNTGLNGLKNCTFVHAPVEKLFQEKKRRVSAKLFNEVRYDTIILDPPRPGLISECVRGIMEIGSRTIVYVSCNPATLARDVKRLSERYALESLFLVDFFPNSYHIESVAFLRAL